MERIADAVRTTVLNEVAELDLAPPLREWPLNDLEATFVMDGDDGGLPESPLGEAMLLGIAMRQDEADL
jgi:hypothetical protein